MTERKMCCSKDLPDNLHETIMNITGEITEALFEVTTRHSKVPAELFVVALNIVYAETLALLVVECTDEMGTDAYLDNEIEVLRKNFELAMKRKE